MNKVIKTTLTSLVFLAVIACGEEAKQISIVKKGNVSYCPNYTMEEIVNSLIDKPKWKMSNGYVNASGVMASGKPANVVMQFWVRDNGEWGMQAIEVDKKPQELTRSDIMELCKRAANNRAKAVEERLSKTNVIPAEPINDSRDGKKYKTVKIGNQTWMAENLNFEAKGSKCYKNDPANCQKYGRLYDWNTAKTACPSGWHLPSNTEWDKLLRYVDGSSGTESPYKDEIAGKYLKAKSGWNNNGNGEDKLGFSALPGGEGYSDGDFRTVGDHGNWWSASEYNSNNAYYMIMSDVIERAYYNDHSKGNLSSVRCLQD